AAVQEAVDVADVDFEEVGHGCSRSLPAMRAQPSAVTARGQAAARRRRLPAWQTPIMAVMVVPFPEASLRVVCAAPDGDGTGAALWPSGLALAQAIFSGRWDLSGSEVLDLGCGL